MSAEPQVARSTVPVEHELDPMTKERTGRTRASQWVRRTLRFQAVPPSQRGDAPFTEGPRQAVGEREEGHP